LSEPTSNSSPSPPARLESWKEIAAYLGRQVRTVQLWEKSEGLPVHRLPHKSRSSVFAYAHELDLWRARQAASVLEEAPPSRPPADPEPPRPPAPAWRGRLAAAAILLAVMGLSWLAARVLRRGSAPAPLPLTRRYFAKAGRAGGSVRLIPTPALGGQEYLTLSPDGKELLAAATDGTVQRIAIPSGAVTRRYTVPPGITAAALSPDGRRLYLPREAGALTILHLASGAAQSIPLQGATGGAVLSPGGRYLYVAMPYVGLERLNTATLRAVHWIEPACPSQLALSPDGRHIYVSFQCGGPGGSAGHDALGILDAADGRVIAHLVGPPRVGGAFALSPNAAELWTNDNGACSAPAFDHRGCPSVPADVLEIANLSDPSQWRTLAVPVPAQGRGFGSITFLPGGERALDGDTMFDTTRLSRLERLPARFAPNGAALAARTDSHLYVPVVYGGRTAIADFAPTPAACSPPTSGLLDWWPGDGTADDAWGMVNGSGSPTAGYAPGVAGEAFDLSQDGAFVALGPDGALIHGLGGMTIAAWVNPSRVGAAPILSYLAPGGRAGWSLGLNVAGHLDFCVGGGARDGCAPGQRTHLTGARPLSPGAWHAVAIEAGAHSVSLYLDGQPDGGARLPLRWTETRTTLLFGAGPRRRHFLRGGLDEVMLYERNLSSAELRALARTPACLAAAH
jgi:hypothetical protein